MQLYLAFARSTTLKVATLPRVQSLDHTNPRRGLRGARKSCNFTSRSVARTTPIHCKGCAGCRRVGKKLQHYLAFGRSTTPIHGKGCAGRRRVGKKLQHYLAFGRSMTPIHGKGCAPPQKVETLLRVRSLDHANPWEGLRVAPKSCNFTSRSVVRPRQSMGKAARHAEMLEEMCNFTSRSRVRPPIHGKGCASPQKVATLPRVHALDHANPW